MQTPPPPVSAGTRLKILLTDSPFENLVSGGGEELIEHDGAELDVICRL
jgi:hypothetical protein